MDLSEYCLLVTRTSPGGKKQQGITNFLVDTRLLGIDVRKIDTLGQRAIGTTQVFYNEVKVPASAVLGEVDRGWEAVDAYLFFFSSRRRHTRCSRDWSSDVCSSD